MFRLGSTKGTMREIAELTTTADDARMVRDTIIEEANDVIIASYRLADYRRWLTRLNKSQAIYNAAKSPEITIAANNLYSGSQRVIEKGVLTPPERLMPDAIINRLAVPITGRKPTILDVHDIMVALSLRPAELISLQVNVKNGTATGVAKSRDDQPRQLVSFALDPAEAKARLDWVRKGMRDGDLPPLLSQKYRTPIAPLLMADLRKLGAEYTAQHLASEGGRIPHEGMKMQYRRLALRHSDSNRPSSAEFYSNVVMPK